ncbi:MAG: hypothetical protein ACOYM2_11575 [Rectinemataceae bacterium]
MAASAPCGSGRETGRRRTGILVIVTICVVAITSGCAKVASAPAGAEAAGPAHAAAAPPPSAIVILVREAVAGATVEAQASTGKQSPVAKGAPAANELLIIPEGKLPLLNRAQALFKEALAARKVDAMIIQPAHKGIAEAIRRSRSADSATLWILVRPGDSALAVESEADLAVEVGGFADGQELDPAIDSALARGLCELARRAGTKGLPVDDRALVKAALDSVGGYEWTVDYRVDPDTGVKAKAHVVATPRPWD